MEKSKLSAFMKRAITAAIIAPVSILILFLGAPFVNLFFFLCGALLAWEWASMVPNKKPVFYAVTYTYVVAVMAIFGVFLVEVSLACIVIASLLVWFKAKGEEHRKLLTLGVPYIALGFGSLSILYDVAGFAMFLWYVLVIWCMDVGGYLVGSTVKGPKLAPSISPKKTWSGLVGGMALAALVSTVYIYYFISDTVWVFALAAAVIAAVSQIGDLVESKIKRGLGIKDSSDLIPGHGGMFDRVDGLIFAAPFVLIAMLIFFYM